MLLKKKSEGVACVRILRTTFFKFSIHLSVGKPKAILWRNLRTGTPPNFFSAILCFVALVYN